MKSLILTQGSHPKSIKGREYLATIPPLEQGRDYLAWRLRNDPDFFFKKLLKIESKNELISFVPNYHQKILLNIYRALNIAQIPVRIIILKARRLGMSTAVEGLAFQDAVLNQHRQVKVVAHDRESAEYIFNMSRLFYDELHESVRPMKRYDKKDGLVFENPKDEDRPTNPGLRSRITIATAGGTSVGRGQQVNLLHLSESAHYSNAGDLSSGLLQTVDYRPGTAVFLESTANGTGNWFHDQYWGHKEGKESLIQSLVDDHEDIDKLVSHLESYQGTVGFIPLFFAWHEFADYQLPIQSEAEKEHIQETLDAEEQELIDLYDLSLQQLKWRRAKIDELARTAEGIPPLELFKQEYPASDREAFLSTGRTIFDAKALGNMKTNPPILKGRFMSEAQPIFTKAKGYKARFLDHPFGELAIYVKPKKGHQYAIGGDTAFADRGRDYSCLEVLDKETLEQVAEWHGKIDPDELGKYSMMLGALYNNAIVAIERNNMGIGSLIALRDTNYPHLYVSKQYAKVDGENPLDSLGWDTTSSTKPKAIGDLIEHIRKNNIHFNSEALISECLSFRYDERGRMNAEEGKHDDRVMAMAIALQAVIDYPFQKEEMTLQKMFDQQDFQNTLVTDTPAWDSELGDILP